ncbi:MAG: site-specific integrase [Muribaculaceae bacterium]|nr:site-specific integrase [Muribaculaceae bacterium]
MASTKFYLDTRRASEGGYSLRINICQHTKTAAFNLGVKLAKNQWNATTNTIVNHPEAKYWNNFISKRKVEIDTIILKIEDENPGQLASMSALQIRDLVNAKFTPADAPKQERKPKEDPNTFLKWFDRFTSRKEGRTKGIYEATRKRLVAWIGEEQLAKVKFEDIKVAWLEEFEDFLSLTAGANANAIHFRNIRTVVNYAIDNEVTTYYAFRRFKIKTESTRKRNFDITTLRRIFTHTCAEEWQQKYLDFFKLSFMLIGINVVDLCGLKKITNGRVDYIRAKTHRPYSIKVESEAREIIDRYAGSEGLVNFAENYGNYRHFYNNLCKGLGEVKQQLGIEELTTYWARHSWATIAHKLGVSKDVIAQALGHGSHTVTDIYIEEDTKAMDEANRKVLDYVLYGAVEKPVEEKKRRGRPRKAA